MNSLSLIVLFHILTGIHGEERGQNRFNWECILDFGVDTLFTCLHKKYHEEKDCNKIVRMEIQRVMYSNLTDDCLVNICTKSYKKTNNCSKEDCRKLLSLSKGSFNCDDGTSGITKDENGSKRIEENGGSIERKDDIKRDSQNFNDNIDDANKEWKRNENTERNYKNGDRKNYKKGLFKVGAIVGISVGITGTIILFLSILAIIYVCRRRSKRKKRKKQSIDQRLQIAHYESGSFSTHMGGNNVISATKPLNKFEEQGKNYVIGPYNTKYDKDLCNRKLPEIKRCSGADGDESVYFEIDNDKIISSRDKEGVNKNNIKEVTDKVSYHSDQTRYEIQLGSKRKKRKNQRRQQSIDQRLEMKNLESGSSSTNKGEYIVFSENKSLNMYEEQGENYMYVLDSSITQYDKDLRNRKLPEMKRCSGAEGDENVYYEIDEDKIKYSTDVEGVYQDKIKDVTDKCSYHSDQTGYEIPLGSMKKKREKLTKLFANESFNTDEANGEYFVLDPSITKNDKDLISLVLPEIKRFSVPQGDKRVYNEIDEGMEGVFQKEIEEFKDKCPYNNEENIYETPRSPKNERDQLIRLQSDDQIMAHLENSPSGVNKGDKVIMSADESLNTDEEQGEYFVLDPSVTNYEKDLNNRMLPEVKRLSVVQCDENVYNEIDEDRIESSPVIKVNQQKQIEDVTDIVIHRTDHINHGTHLGFDNTTYHVVSEIDDKSF